MTGNSIVHVLKFSNGEIYMGEIPTAADGDWMNKHQLAGHSFVCEAGKVIDPESADIGRRIIGFFTRNTRAPLWSEPGGLWYSGRVTTNEPPPPADEGRVRL